MKRWMALVFVFAREHVCERCMVEVRSSEEPNRVYRVNGRTAQIVQWLMMHSAELEPMSRMQLTFHCVERRITAVETRCFENIPIDKQPRVWSEVHGETVQPRAGCLDPR
jgi:hypothetical protein